MSVPSPYSREQWARTRIGDWHREAARDALVAAATRVGSQPRVAVPRPRAGATRTLLSATLYVLFVTTATAAVSAAMAPHVAVPGDDASGHPARVSDGSVEITR